MKRLILFFLVSISTVLYGGDRKVLIEMFTNSHCGVCPGAHNTIKSYLNSSGNADKINMIFYHMTFPYSDDQLAQANTADPSGRNNYYGPFSSTPVSFFDGKVQANNYSSWASILNQQLTVVSPLEISLTGIKESNSFSINASITRTGDIDQNDLVIHFVVTENVTYVGRNGVSPQIFVMRKMITTSGGESFSINPGETINVNKTINLESNWISDSLSVVVFVQSTGSKVIYQSENISYKNLGVTSIGSDLFSPYNFSLSQNYPNPFNPVTKIKFTIPQMNNPLPGEERGGLTTLKIYDILGNEVATLVNEPKEPGIYEVEFEASHLSSGVYFYTLRATPTGGQAGEFNSSKKMVLLK